MDFFPDDSYLGDLRLFLQVRAAFMFRSPDFFAGWVGLAECWPGGRGYVPDHACRFRLKAARARARGRPPITRSLARVIRYVASAAGQAFSQPNPAGEKIRAVELKRYTQLQKESKSPR